MKYTIIMLLSLLLVACSNQSQGQTAEDGPLTIVATTTHAADILEQVGGDLIQVEGLMGPGVDPHDYQPSASDVELINEADAVAYNGLHLEAMFTSVFESLEDMGKPTLILAEGLSEDDILASEEDDLAYDPHIWFSVDAWQSVTVETAEFLSELDPANASDYEANAESYLAELDQLDLYIQEQVEKVPEESRYLITAHDAFGYFAEDYDFEVVGIQGLNPQTEAGTQDISELADFIVEQDIQAVFVESSVSSRNVEALIEAVEARGSDLELGGELYSDALGSHEDGAGTYIDMYQANIDTIVAALGNEE